MLKIAQQSLIVLSSHNLDDIEQIASEIIFIEEGKLKFHRDISQLREEQNQYAVVRFQAGVSAISMKGNFTKRFYHKIIPHKIKRQKKQHQTMTMCYIPNSLLKQQVISLTTKSLNPLCVFSTESIAY